jgi:hypothetical protein
VGTLSMQKPGGAVLGKRNSGELLDAAFSPERSILQSSGDADLVGVDPVQDPSSSGSLDVPTSKRVIIDIQRARRKAEVAGLAPGFLIETDYPTQQRKVVQHIPKPGLRIVTLHFEGEKVLLDDPLLDGTEGSLPSHSVSSIKDRVLSAHDDAQYGHLACSVGPANSRPLSFPSYPQRDLA